MAIKQATKQSLPGARPRNLSQPRTATGHGHDGESPAILLLGSCTFLSSRWWIWTFEHRERVKEEPETEDRGFLLDEDFLFIQHPVVNLGMTALATERRTSKQRSDRKMVWDEP